MRKYKVNVEVLYNRIIEIDAEDDEDAENKVADMYENKQIIMDKNDLQEVKFFVQE